MFDKSKSFKVSLRQWPAKYKVEADLYQPEIDKKCNQEINLSCAQQLIFAGVCYGILIAYPEGYSIFAILRCIFFSEHL